jgi:predicted alpha/beta superfamily hydrolase
MRNLTPIRGLILFLFAPLIVIWVVPGQAAEPGLRQDAGAFRSVYTGWTYPLRVYLPASYAESERNYPVLYALDGRIRFNLIANQLDELGAEVIVVAIDATTNARREIDFVIPGAGAFALFLSEELIPWTEQQYRTDPSARGLAGHSLAGLFCALMLLFEDPDQRQFNAFLISDGSFWDMPEKTEQLVARLRVATDSLPVNLFIAAAIKGDGNYKGSRIFYSLMEESGFSDFNVTYEVYKTNHKGVIEPSFRDGLAWLYVE